MTARETTHGLRPCASLATCLATVTEGRRRSVVGTRTAGRGRSNRAAITLMDTGTSAPVRSCSHDPLVLVAVHCFRSLCLLHFTAQSARGHTGLALTAVWVLVCCRCLFGWLPALSSFSDGAGSTVDAPFEMNVNGQMLILQDGWNQAPHSTNSGPTRPELLYPDTFCGERID